MAIDEKRLQKAIEYFEKQISVEVLILEKNRNSMNLRRNTSEIEYNYRRILQALTVIRDCSKESRDSQAKKILKQHYDEALNWRNIAEADRFGAFGKTSVIRAQGMIDQMHFHLRIVNAMRYVLGRSDSVHGRQLLGTLDDYREDPEFVETCNAAATVLKTAFGLSTRGETLCLPDWVKINLQRLLEGKPQILPGSYAQKAKR